jgi:ribose-phosphate pyrophosphokinase
MSGESPIVFFSGSSNFQLSQKVAEELGIKIGEELVDRFPDGEIRIEIKESVRGKRVYILQSTNAPADNLMELLIMLDAVKRASAKEITAIIPFFGYSRQDRKTKPREPITAKLVSNLITVAGADRIISLDLHAGQIQGFFDMPVDNLTAAYLFADYIKEKNLEKLCVLSPDVGGVSRASKFAELLQAEQAIFVKRRLSPKEVEIQTLIGKVKGKNVIILDDAIHTGSTLIQAAIKAKEAGAKKVFACATHAVLSGYASLLLEDSSLEEVIVTDTIFISTEKSFSKLKVLTVANLIKETIFNIQNNISVSELFK